MGKFTDCVSRSIGFWVHKGCVYERVFTSVSVASIDF